MRTRSSPSAARGFVLLELAIAAAILVLGGIWLASRMAGELEDAGAHATARHLLAVRGAVQELMVRHFDVLTGHEPAPGAPAPELPAFLSRPLPLVLSVDELREPQGGTPGYLPADFPPAPVYGGATLARIEREGECPGADCRLIAFVHTTEPLRAAGVADYSPELVGAFLVAAEGHGGHASPGAPGRLRGPILDAANPLGEMAGVVAVSASLDVTLFNQFVRQGDTRPVWLRNSLDVRGAIVSGEGIAFDTAVVPGEACVREGLYATTSRRSLAMCLTGVWFELTAYAVTQVVGDLADGDALPEPGCPAPTQPFVRVALQALDASAAGADVDVRGALAGSVSGTGSVNQAGAVVVSGSFAGSVHSTPDSRVRVAQAGGALGGRVTISGAGEGARAFAIAGCRHG